MSRRSRSSETIIAHHEAGHAVAALRLGVPVHHVTIDPENDDGGIVLGHVRFLGGDKDPPSLSHRLLLVSLSGPAAQRRFAPRSPIRMNGRSDFEHARCESELVSSSPTAARSLTRWAECESRSFVEREWPLIQNVAALLIERRTLSGDDLQEALAPIEAARESVAADYRRDFLKSPEHVQAAAEERAAAWRRMRPIRRADVASAALRVVIDAIACGDNVSPERLRAALGASMAYAGFDESASLEKIAAMVAKRAPAVSWKAVSADGQGLRDSRPGGSGDALPAQSIIPEVETEHAA